MAEIVYPWTWENLKMENVGPGDADVFTKSKRHTTVKLKLSSPILEPHLNRLKTHVIYDVIEGRRDYTHLQMSTDIFIELPPDWSDIKVLGAADYDVSTVFYGQNHVWNELDTKNSVNWITKLEAKIDGPGDDAATGNAGLRINFGIPIRFNLKA